MTTPGTSTLTCSIHIVASVREFIEYLQPSSGHWNSAKRGDLAYRGQASSEWSLVPKAFRSNQVIGYGSDAPRGVSRQVNAQAQAEFNAVHQFVIAADNSRLQVTEGGAKFLAQEHPAEIFSDHDWAYSWPDPGIIETIALAQHHGVPTRLLDFSEDPLVACYFAAYFALELQQAQKKFQQSVPDSFAVWVIDLRFIRDISRVSGRYPERIAEIRVPRANNSYLQAQSAFFLMDRGANDVLSLGEPLSIDKALADRAEFWHNGNRLSGKGLSQRWFDEVPVRQIRLHARHAIELLRELENRGVTKASVMPSFDRIVESLEFQRNLPR